jgi:hypothetical protein
VHRHSRLWRKLNHTSAIHMRRMSFFLWDWYLWESDYERYVRRIIFCDSLLEVFNLEGHIIVLKIVTMKVRSVEPTDCPKTASISVMYWCTNANYSFLVEICKAISVFKLHVPTKSVVVVVVVVNDDDDNGDDDDDDDYNNIAKWALFLSWPIHFKRLVGRRLIPRLWYFPEWS